MRIHPSLRLVLVVLAPVVLASCGSAARESPSAGAPSAARSQHTEADVRFMHGMLAHHRQALAMTSLVPARSDRQNIELLAQRIEVSQQDEIAMMQRWLADRGQEVPVADHSRHGAGAHGAMPGMLTEEEMARLAAATGTEFDRLFLEYMIRHHEGALVMVADLFATPGAGQQVDVFRIASEVDADQRMEIERMRALLDSLR